MCNNFSVVQKRVLPGPDALYRKKTQAEKNYKEARTAIVALAVIAALVAAMGLTMMGLGTSPQTMTIGYGIIPYLFGSQLTILSGALIGGIAVVGMVAFYYHRRQQTFKYTSFNGTPLDTPKKKSDQI